MRHSFVSQAEAQTQQMATGHRWWFGFAVPASLPERRDQLPQAYLIASAEDMTTYLRAHLGSETESSATVLSPAGLRALHQPIQSTQPNQTSARRPDYGMGWFKWTLDGRTLLEHDGIVPNFYAKMALVPEERLGVILLVNAQHSIASVLTPALGQILNGVLAQMLKRPTPHSVAFKAIYLALDGAIVVVLALQNWSLLHLWAAPPLPVTPVGWLRDVALPTIVDLGWPLALVYGVRKMAQMPLSVFARFAPDLGAWIMATVALAWATGALRVALALINRR
jgi:hypothetical protein